MSEQPPARKQLVLVFDRSGPAEVELRDAIALAVSIDAELQGLWLEDEQLGDLAALPFTREFSPFSEREREFTAAEVRRWQQRLIEQCRRQLHALAGSVSWSFTVQRGALRTICAAEAGGDVLWLSRRLQIHNRAPDRAPVNGAIYVWCDGSPGAERALALATQIARSRRRPLTVIAVGASPSAEFPQLRLPPDTRPQDAEQFLRPRSGDWFIVPLSLTQNDHNGDLEHWLERSKATVLLVR